MNIGSAFQTLCAICMIAVGAIAVLSIAWPLLGILIGFIFLFMKFIPVLLALAGVVLLVKNL